MERYKKLQIEKYKTKYEADENGDMKPVRIDDEEEKEEACDKTKEK